MWWDIRNREKKNKRTRTKEGGMTRRTGIRKEGNKEMVDPSVGRGPSQRWCYWESRGLRCESVGGTCFNTEAEIGSSHRRLYSPQRVAEPVIPARSCLLLFANTFIASSKLLTALTPICQGELPSNILSFFSSIKEILPAWLQSRERILSSEMRQLWSGVSNDFLISWSQEMREMWL